MADVHINRREAIGGAMTAGAALAFPDLARADSSTESWSMHFDHVLGTSLDLHFVGGVDAADVEVRIFTEIDRLRRVFSLFDPDSELSVLSKAPGRVAASSDLFAVLQQYTRWQLRTGGACNALVGAFTPYWKTAEALGEVPSRQLLGALAVEISRTGWSLDEVSGTLTRLSSHVLDLNAGAKGFIIGRIGEVVRSFPGITAGLVNLGGDMFAWGGHWPVAIQHPFDPEENAKPLGAVRLKNAAIATSGGYQRFYTVNGVRHSHLIDPRTGMPADGVASATVIAPDSVTANMLATTFCILKPEESLRLVSQLAGVSTLIVTADGHQIANAGFPLLPVEPTRTRAKTIPVSLAEPWPEDFRLSITIELPKIDNTKRYRRPYVAVWIEDAAGKPVKTLSVWGNAPRYLKDLTDWWKIGKGNDTLIKAVTRATRAPGRYELAWDGTDDADKPVGQGTYTVRVEVHREHGKHLRQSGKIECEAEPATLKLEKNEETGETLVAYGKKKQS